MGPFDELRAQLERLPVLKAPLATLLRRLQRVDLPTLTDSALVEHGAKAHVGERDMQTILTAFRTFRGVRWAPGLKGMFTIEDVVHRLCCQAKNCARCSAMASKVALDPEFQARLARAARQTLAVLR